MAEAAGAAAFGGSRTFDCCAAVIVPLIVQSPLLVAYWSFNVQWANSPAALLIGVAFGFIFLIREFGRFSTLLAVAYVPAMTIFLACFSLLFVGCSTSIL